MVKRDGRPGARSEEETIWDIMHTTNNQATKYSGKMWTLTKSSGKPRRKKYGRVFWRGSTMAQQRMCHMNQQESTNGEEKTQWHLRWSRKTMGKKRSQEPPTLSNRHPGEGEPGEFRYCTRWWKNSRCTYGKWMILLRYGKINPIASVTGSHTLTFSSPHFDTTVGVWQAWDQSDYN